MTSPVASRAPAAERVATPGPGQADAVRHLLATLVGCGLRHLVVAPGSRSTPLVQAAVERGELTLHVALDERSAGFLALGLHRGGGGLTGVLCTSGSALGHLLPACIEAGEAGDALLVLSADRPVAVRGFGAPQAIWQPGLLAPYAGDCVEVAAAGLAVEAERSARERLWIGIEHALHEIRVQLARAAHAGGVVHVNVPLDLPLALAPGLPTPAAPPVPERQPLPVGPALPPPALGERVLLIAGPLRPDPGLAALVAALAQLHDLVGLCEATSHLRHATAPAGLDVRHYDALLRDPAILERLRPDRIVRVGTWPTSKGLQLLLEHAARQGVPVDVVHPHRRSDPLRQARLHLDLDPVAALRPWRTAPPAGTTAWQAAWRQADAAAEQSAQRLRSGLLGGDAALTEPALVQRLAAVLGEDDLIVLGNSMPIRDWDAFAPPGPAGLVVGCSRGANGIDGTLATALGRAVASGRPTTVYLGDCAFLHDVGSLQLLADRAFAHAGLQVVVANNDGGAIFDYLPARAALAGPVHRRFFTTPHGQQLAAIASGFGLPALQVATVAELDAALARRLGAGDVRIVEAKVDAETSHAWHRTWQAALAAAARAALGIAP